MCLLESVLAYRCFECLATFGRLNWIGGYLHFFRRTAIMQESKYRVRMNDERRDVMVKPDSVTVVILWRLFMGRLLSGIRLV